MELSPHARAYIISSVLILLGTVTQGSIGFGLGTISTPIVALLRPDLVPTLILLLALFISILRWRAHTAKPHGA